MRVERRYWIVIFLVGLQIFLWGMAAGAASLRAYDSANGERVRRPVRPEDFQP